MHSNSCTSITYHLHHIIFPETSLALHSTDKPTDPLTYLHSVIRIRRTMA